MKLLGIAIVAATIVFASHGNCEEAMPEHGSGSHTPPETEEPSSPEPADAVPAYDGPVPVVRDIRSLFALQDAVANGHRSAVELQKALIGQVGVKLLQDEMTKHADRLAPSVAGYVLSGGNPLAAERLSESEHISRSNRHLLKGSAFYMQGKMEEAGGELKHVEIENLPPPVGGRVALAQAMLAGSEHDTKQKLLQTAIALMPGSLVEESALRRSALSYAETGNQQQFWLRSSRYLRRFPRSLYAADFMSEVVSRIVAMEVDGKTPDLNRLDLLLAKLDSGKRKILYAELARLAAARNLSGLAKSGARRLRRLAAPGSPEAELAEVYDWIFDVASENSIAAAVRLRSVRGDLLPSRERSLLAAALMVTDQIEEPVKAGAASAPIERDQEQAAIQLRANTVLEKARALLKETQQ